MLASCKVCVTRAHVAKACSFPHCTHNLNRCLQAANVVRRAKIFYFRFASCRAFNASCSCLASSTSARNAMQARATIASSSRVAIYFSLAKSRKLCSRRTSYEASKILGVVESRCSSYESKQRKAKFIRKKT